MWNYISSDSLFKNNLVPDLWFAIVWSTTEVAEAAAAAAKKFSSGDQGKKIVSLPRKII